MREILLINPRAARGRKSKKVTRKSKVTINKKRRVLTMPKKRKARRKPAKRRYTAPARRRARRNPSPSRRKRVVSRAKGAFGGLNFRKVLKDMPAIQIGMFAAKWAAKRWGEAASETDPASWNWASYAKGSFGAVAAAFIAGAIKPGLAQKVLEGGLNQMAYKAIQNELIAPSDWATAQFGADDDYQPDEYLTAYEDENGAFMPGPGGTMLPADERHRIAGVGMGDTLQPVGPLGEVLQPVGPLGDVYDQAWSE